VPSKPRGKAKAIVKQPIPRPIEEVPLVGHQGVLEHLRTALAKGRLGQAFLFVGPDGIGKRRLARHLAQSLLCETRPPVDLDHCGQCPSCMMVRAGTHPDLLQVQKPDDKTELPIALIQELTSQLSLKPARGTRKIAIVNDADSLNEESANGFLKTLEEPPVGSVLILVAHSQESQLPTIQSRCQMARFLPLSEEEVARVLLQLGRAATPEDARLLSQRSAGSVSQAIEWAKPEWVEIEQCMVDSLSRKPLPSPSLAGRLLPFIEEAGKESAPKRNRARLVVRRFMEILREALRSESGGASSSPLPAGQWDPDLLVDLIDRTLDADYHILRMASVPLVVETWLDDLARLTEGRRLEPIY
jgi:DNA polymerase-3 subunit delta'